RDRAGHRRPGPRLRNGLDEQEHPSDQGRAAGRGGRGDDPGNRRGAPQDLARHEAEHDESVGRVLDQPQEGRQGQRTDQVDHRLRRFHRTAGRHRRPGAPFRPVVVGDPFSNYVATHDKGSLVSGTVKSLDGKGAVIALDGDVEGYLRASEVARDRVEDIRSHLKEGDSVNAMIINIDRKNRSINLSIKAKDSADESEALQRMTAENSGTTAGTTNLGALLKAKLDNKNQG